MRRESFLYVWNLSSFGMEIIDAWFETPYFVYELGLETPKLISCYIGVEKNSKTPIYVFLVDCKPCLRVVFEGLSHSEGFLHCSVVEKDKSDSLRFTVAKLCFAVAKQCFAAA